MEHFLTGIQINKIFHLENIKIDIDDKEKKHLLITGKNGCGKTSLLNALVKFLQRISSDKMLTFLAVKSELEASENHYKKLIQIYNKIGEDNDLKRAMRSAQIGVEVNLERYNNASGELEVEFTDILAVSKDRSNNEFLFAFYQAKRETKVVVESSPVKPDLRPVNSIIDSKQKEFVKFLVDLKIQEALADRNGDLDYANEIKAWFDSFEELLNELFEGEQVKLHFNFKNYAFTIQQNGREFGFNELSDGYSAIIDIIADLILKMQDPENLTRAYKKQGIVLIDEIETHLHLELQKAILPMLTRVFPNIQFIVTTHSPFVLNSIDNAVAYDLEKRERLDELHEYSYEALAEGYFDVSTDSTFLDSKLKRLQSLFEKETRDSAEEAELERLDQEFKKVLDDALIPESVKIQYKQIKLNS